MAKRTQSNNRLERQKDQMQQRTIYDLVSQMFARCICGTRRKSPGGESHHQILQPPGQEGPGWPRPRASEFQKPSAEARLPTRGSSRAAGHDLYANERTDVPARDQAIVGTGIAIGRPHNTYGRIASRSSLAVKHQLMTNAGVIDSDYRGEVKVILANLGDQPYRLEKGEGIAQLIIEKIDNRELQK